LTEKYALFIKTEGACVKISYVCFSQALILFFEKQVDPEPPYGLIKLVSCDAALVSAKSWRMQN
jgi:hypothetical protein